MEYFHYPSSPLTAIVAQFKLPLSTRGFTTDILMATTLRQDLTISQGLGTGTLTPAKSPEAIDSPRPAWNDEETALAERYLAVHPPSIRMSVPVIKPAYSEQR
jgi:hypothetical protein